MKVTLITGASGGIGEAIVNRLAERKQNLLLIARNAEKLEKQGRELAEKFGIQVQFIAADLADPETAERIFKETQNRGLEIDMLINNAGIGSGGEFSSLSLKSELSLLQLNVSSLVALTHLFLPQMQNRKSGTIINIASMASFIPIPYMATYAASKMFVRSFTQAVTQECKPYNVHMLLFCPGLTKTNFNSAAGIDNEKGGGLSSDYSNSPTQTPEEVADELLQALDKKRSFAVSGRMNRFGSRLLALIPNSFITRNFAKLYRKRLKM
ncbi:SDR family oxidoreductase [Pedobacter sp. L105]|uniref:SDR family NAD(P)-dependent oxidoreductase n=1 Tax=Pedobacter sp. L105 TaxID=1641871 RepID=UPI00131D7612|nr:SDR family oxidoreductase [Pedobacter sp. L105]